MEYYITVSYDNEKHRYPQSVEEAIERALELDNELCEYFEAITKGYSRRSKIDKNTDKDNYMQITSDIEGWIKEVCVIYGKLKFLVEYTKDYSYERLRRTSLIVLELEALLYKSINHLLDEFHKDKVTDREYKEFCIGIGYRIKDALKITDFVI